MSINASLKRDNKKPEDINKYNLREGLSCPLFRGHFKGRVVLFEELFVTVITAR
jgi:hypothetical protein